MYLFVKTACLFSVFYMPRTIAFVGLRTAVGGSVFIKVIPGSGVLVKWIVTTVHVNLLGPYHAEDVVERRGLASMSVFYQIPWKETSTWPEVRKCLTFLSHVNYQHFSASSYSCNSHDWLGRIIVCGRF